MRFIEKVGGGDRALGDARAASHHGGQLGQLGGDLRAELPVQVRHVEGLATIDHDDPLGKRP